MKMAMAMAIMISLMIGTWFGYGYSHKILATDCTKMGGFYVGTKTYNCSLVKKVKAHE